MLITAVTFLTLSLLGLLAWILVLVRARRMVRSQPTIRAGLDHAPASMPRVSVVVPAHDEARVIDRCATSLRDQHYPDLEMIFVLDRCTDETLDILRPHADADDRVTIIENETCPDGWAGKCNAARVGAEAASGTYLLFTDADTIFEPDLVRAAVGLAETRGVALLSLLSTLTTDHAFERIAQPVATMTLVRMFPIDRIHRPDRPSRPFANGQFMLFRRDVYDAIGGHGAVSDDLLEDIAFARLVHANGGTCGAFIADGMLVCSMYSSYAAFREGWKRIFIEACKRKPGRLRKNGWRSILIGIAWPVFQLGATAVGAGLLASLPVLGGALLAVVGVGLAIQVWTLGYAYGLGGTPRTAIFWFPIGSVMVGRILLEAAADLEARRPIQWGGRAYVLEPR